MERVDFSEQNLANKLKVGLKEWGLAHAQVLDCNFEPTRKTLFVIMDIFKNFILSKHLLSINVG